MTFNFDGGDILILLLVAIALFLFRRLDKTGRSLEKVRRYAEKSKGDLDAIVRERELGLKDLAVDLEVQEKTNREILARADAAREEILSRAEELEGRVERIEAHEKALDDLNDLALRVDENLSRLRDESAYVDDVGLRLSEVRSQFSAMAEKDAARFEEFRKYSLDVFGEDLTKMNSGLEETSRELALFQETLESLNARRDEAAGEKINAFRDDLESVEEDFRERLRKVAEEGSRLEDEAFTALNEKIDSRSSRLEENWMGGLNELRDRVSTAAAEIQESLSDAKSAMDLWEAEGSERIEKNRNDFDSMENRLMEVSAQLESDISAFESRLDGDIENLNHRLNSLIDKKETDLLESVEIRQNEYRKTVEDRFENIEGFIKDMDAVAESLKISQKNLLKEVDEVFVTFDGEMTRRRELEKASLDEEASSLKREMEDLERGLDELKARAYDNVSEKLQVFEDDFFADLKNRDEQIRAAFDEWRNGAEEEMAELALKAGREREETERRYSTELKQKLTELQTRILGQFEAFQDQVDAFRESSTSRIRSAEDDLTTFRGELSTRIAAERSTAFEEFSKTFEAFEKQTTERFAKADKVISQRLSGFSGDIESRSKELAADVQAARDENAEWRERLTAQTEEASRAAREGMETIKSDIAARIAELRDEYSGRTEQLILESGEERASLRREIAALEESLVHVSSELTEKSRDSLDALKEQSESFLLEFRKNTREARDEVERKIKDLRQSVQESRERAEANRKEMAAHTDTEYARLMRNLDEIDKRQREFIAETRIFERADEMKQQLEADIAELAKQLDAVGAGREEIRSVNAEYEKAVGLYDEVSGKLARFLSEQQKVENLEGKIARIGSLSESVDLKLDRVTESNDTLQDLMVRLKQLEDLHEDLGIRYERLSEKSNVLDAATDGIDKNFERMNRIEDILKDVAERILPLRDELDGIERKQSEVFEEREKMQTALDKIVVIDSTLNELDARIDDLTKARKWLAGIETRLEEINADAQQHIRLLGSLSERDGKRKKSAAGSPDMSTRDMVVKLAREGWSSEEISRTTKLSLGEVELILEITPRNNV